MKEATFIAKSPKNMFRGLESSVKVTFLRLFEPERPLSQIVKPLWVHREKQMLKAFLNEYLRDQ